MMKDIGRIPFEDLKKLGGLAILRRARISPKKMRQIADLIRNLNVQKADYILRFTPKKGSMIMRKVIRSAVASYRDKFEPEKSIDEIYPSLRIALVKVDKGPMWKIPKPAAKPARFGGNAIFRRRTSHITVFVMKEGK